MEIKLLPCPLCFKPHFQGVDSLRSSLINVATSHLTCPVCSESLLGLDKLTIHLFTHISENNNNNNSSVKHFEETATTNNEKEIAESINNFKETPKEDDNDPVKCDICYFTFTDKALLDMHQNLLHQTTPDKNTGLYSYHCHLCSKIFKKRGSLMVHLRVAHYGFGHHNFEQLSKNMDTVKLDIQSPKLTNEQFKFQDNKQWECDVCSKMFTTKYFLKKHKRLHTGIYIIRKYNLLIVFLKEKCLIFVPNVTNHLRSSNHIINTCFIILQKSHIFVQSVDERLKSSLLYKITLEFILEKGLLVVKLVVGNVLLFS